MNLCRFKDQQDQARVGLVLDDSTLLDLTPAGVRQMQPLLESDDPVAQLNQMASRGLPRLGLAEVRLCAPLERQEVWAAGVTYLRSKTARMEESDFGATAYDRVYAAERPELFFKSLAGESGGHRRAGRHSQGRPLERAGAGIGAGAQFAREHRRLHHRQRHERARHRGREPALSPASQDL